MKKIHIIIELVKEKKTLKYGPFTYAEMARQIGFKEETIKGLIEKQLKEQGQIDTIIYRLEN